jgi:glycosyltransferase involved in cell wall biosynthesis
MKVLIIAQYFPPDMGGASARAFNVAKGLCEKGCDIIVVAAFPHYPHGKVPLCYARKALAREDIRRIKVLRVWIPRLPHNSVVNRVLLHLSFIVSSLFALPSVGEPDVIWAANPNLFCFFSALVYGLVKRKPIVRNVDDLWPEVFYEMGVVRSKLMKALLDFLAKLSYVLPVAITPISNGYKRRIVEKYGVSAEKFHVVEVGVDSVDSFLPDNNKKSRFVVMYSGVLGVGYDFETVLKAAGSLSQYEDIVFFIRGVGELAPKLERLIRELDLRNVMLDTQFLPKAELSVLLRSADVFLLPMASASFVDEGLPTKVFEYHAYRKPIICCSKGEPARYVESLRAGLVVKPGDPDAVAQAVLKLYKDRKLAYELGLNGWRYVVENLTSERIGERMYNVFLSIRT